MKELNWNAKYPNAQLGVMYCQLPYIEQRKSSGMKEANLNVKMSPIGICSLQKQILERAQVTVLSQIMVQALGKLVDGMKAAVMADSNQDKK